jgi:CrcB protein
VRPRILLAVALGGGLGASARYGLGVAFAQNTPPEFPWVTLVVNLTGAFALGLLLTLVLEVWPPTRYVRPFVGIGVLGGFTTFSSLVVGSSRLIDAGQAPLSIAYLVTSLTAGMLSCAIGYALALRASRLPLTRWGRPR